MSEDQLESNLELSIVMPCLNEAETLAVCIGKAQRFMETSGVKGEVLIADNGSTDGSIAIAENCGARVISVERKGYGAALQGGIEAARGQFVAMGDADDSYDFSALAPFLDELRSGADLVMGNRFRGGIDDGAMPFLHRYLGNPVLSLIGRVFFGSGIGDFHCGLRAFRKESIRSLDLATPGMEFATEMVVKASLASLDIREVPTTLSKDGRSRPPHLRTWRDGWRHFRFMLLFSPRWLFLYPGLLLMAAGGVLGVWLIPGPRVVGSITLDVHTLLFSAMAVLVGFQAVGLAVFARVFATNEGLLRSDERLRRLRDLPALEIGVGAGLLLLAGGLAASLWAVRLWGQEGFGPLDPSITFRTVVPAVLAVTLGCELLLGSFFLSVLDLARTHRKSASPD